MNKLVIASMRENAGKTSLIVGLARAKDRNIGYLKPLGDRLLYRKKRQWDYDASVMTGLFSLGENPEDMTFGFEHAKLKFMYDEEGLKEKFAESVQAIGARDTVFIEGGRTINYGMSIGLDALSLARHADARLVVVVSGNDDLIVDDVAFLTRYLAGVGVTFDGVVVNKVRDVRDFSETHLPVLREMGVNVRGILPFREELTWFSVGYLADKLFAKVLAGEGALTNVVKHIVVGAMSADAVLHAPVFAAEAKLVITSGDRSDMILAAIETGARAVVLTNNILPPALIVAKAAEHNVPLLLVHPDTFATAKQIDDMDPLLTAQDTARADFLADLVRTNVNLDNIL